MQYKIKKVSLLSITLLSLFIVRSGFAQEAQKTDYDLNDCLDYAYAHNQNFIIADLEQDKQKAYVGEIMSAGLPQINFNADVNRAFKIRQTFVDPSIFGGDDNGGGNGNGGSEEELVPVAFGTPYNGDAGFMVNQMVFNGSYFVGLEAAKTFRELATKDKVKTKIDVTEMVTKAYYGVLIAKEGMDILEANFSRTDSLLRETRIMETNGFAEKIDINRIKVQHNNLKTEIENQKQLIDINYQLLKFQMGKPQDEPLVINETIEDLNGDELLSVLGEEKDYTNRVEYDQLNLNQRLARMDMKNNKVQYLPRIDFYFSYGWNAGTLSSSNLFSFNSDYWLNYQTAGLTFSVPIFDGLNKSYKIQQNKIKLEQIKFQRTLLENSIDTEVQQSRTNLENGVRSLQNQNENMSLAKEVYEVAKIKYQQGVGSNLEVVEADNDYKTAQNNYYNALYVALISLVDYQKALGILTN